MGGAADGLVVQGDERGVRSFCGDGCGEGALADLPGSLQHDHGGVVECLERALAGMAGEQTMFRLDAPSLAR